MPADTMSQTPSPKPADGNKILSIVLIYAMFSAGWIWLSDKLVQLIFSAPYQIILVSIVKGWLFVGITSLLLYSLMQRWGGGVTATKIIPVGSRRLRVFFLSLALIIVVLTCATIIHAFKHERAEVIGRMQAVTELKAWQITDWLQQRRGDADFIQNGDFFTEQYRRWQESGDQHSGERLQAQLEQVQKSRGFDAVMLLDPSFKPLWANGSSPLTAAQPVQAAARLAAIKRQTQRAGPYFDASGSLSMDFIIPLTSFPGATPMIVLHLDLMNRLALILHNRSMPGAGGETLLFQADGDRLIPLGQPRQAQEAALKSGSSAATEKLFAAQVLRAVAVAELPEESLDERGISIIGVVRAIPGTDWLLVTKQELSAFYAETVDDVTWSGFAGLLTLFITGTGFYLFQQRQQLALAQLMQQSQAERLRALHLLAAIADSSDGPIVAKDRAGRYILFNRAASRVVGKPAEEVLGRDDRTLFPPEQAEMLIAVSRRVIAENRIITLEERLDTLQGERLFLTTKGPLRDSEGNVIGIFGISRDITERKQTEAALYASELSYRSLFENMMNSVVHARVLFLGETPVDIEYISTNPAFATVTGIVEPVIGRRISEVIPGYCENNPESLEIFGRVAMTGVSTHWEHYLPELKRWFSFMIYSPCHGEVIIVTENITERKQAELALRDSEGRFRALVEQSLAGIYIIQDGCFRYVNPGFAAIFGYDSPAALIDSVPVTDLVDPEDLERVKENVRRRIDGEVACLHYSFAGLRRDGSRIDVEAQGRRFDYQGRPAIIGFILNITERKAVEEALRRQTQELAQRNEELERFNRATVGRELDMIALKQQVNALSRQLGQERIYPLAFLDSEAAQE